MSSVITFDVTEVWAVDKSSSILRIPREEIRGAWIIRDTYRDKDIGITYPNPHLYWRTNEDGKWIRQEGKR